MKSSARHTLSNRGLSEILLKLVNLADPELRLLNLTENAV